jgi:DNA-binding NarL/FixJ family response regulator
MQEHKAWRNAEIYARRCSGLTLKAIAREFRLSKETVREIARRMERKARWAQLGESTAEATSVGVASAAAKLTDCRVQQNSAGECVAVCVE